MNTSPSTSQITDPTNDDGLSHIVVPLLKGVIYQEDNPKQWADLLRLQTPVRDYVKVLGLALMLDEAEGYAFLHTPATDDEQTATPRLVTRRPLSYPVSLLLALLRKKLAETDAGGGDTRLILSRDEVVELMRIFLPDGSNDVKLIKNIDTTLNAVEKLGFVRRLRGQDKMIEVRRIIKAFVDAQWLADFEQQLAQYRDHLEKEVSEQEEDDEPNA